MSTVQGSAAERTEEDNAGQSSVVADSFSGWLMNILGFFKGLILTFTLQSGTQDVFQIFTVKKVSEREDRPHLFMNYV